MNATHGDPDERLEPIIDMLTRLASGDLGARLPVPPDPDQLGLIVVGLNMLAEELSVTLESEKELRRALEELVRQQDADLKKEVAMVQAQSRTILELSTPVLQVWDDVLVIPLIGTIDTVRARQVTGSLLESVSKTQATFVILDVTGVTVIDTNVANHIMLAIRATRMLGARVILTGVGPSKAQTLTKLGVTQEGILECRNTLHAGLRLALQLRDGLPAGRPQAGARNSSKQSAQATGRPFHPGEPV